MLGLRFHHVGLACADIEEAADHVKQAYHPTSDSGTVFDPLQNAFVRLFNAGQPGAIELVAGPAVAGLLKRKTTYYHICYSTPDIDQTLEEALPRGALLVSSPTPAALFEGRRVAFVYTPLGLVEFLQQA